MKTLTDHKISKLNREHINVFASDEPDVDGAHHEYIIDVSADKDSVGSEPVERIVIKFQKGGLAETGVNGITDQALLAIVLDRLRGFQAGPYSCRDNSIAITKLEECLLWMGKRYTDRAARGVEGVRTA
jgi:hypothetical protein